MKNITWLFLQFNSMTRVISSECGILLNHGFITRRAISSRFRTVNFKPFWSSANRSCSSVISFSSFVRKLILLLNVSIMVDSWLAVKYRNSKIKNFLSSCLQRERETTTGYENSVSNANARTSFKCIRYMMTSSQYFSSKCRCKYTKWLNSWYKKRLGNEYVVLLIIVARSVGKTSA